MPIVVRLEAMKSASFPGSVMLADSACRSSDSSGESDTTSGCGSNPTVGNAFDKLYETGNTLVFGETSEITGGEPQLSKAALAIRNASLYQAEAAGRVKPPPAGEKAMMILTGRFG